MTAVAATTGVYRAAVALEAALGDPADPGNPHGFAAMRDRAARAEFPHALAAAAGPALRLSYLPTEAGGELSTVDETLFAVRVAARRDVTVMPATMFSVTAATCVLLAGTPEQRDEVVRLLRAGGSVGFALSEPDHGSDLLANSCALDRISAGEWRLSGDKWLVGLGRRADALLVVARSGSVDASGVGGGRGPAAFTALLLDGPTAATARTEADQHPTGMRGIDFAGFHFTGARVPDGARVGEVGRGLETAMRAMQLVRILSTGANLAAADTGLRLTLDFAARHVVAHLPVGAHPHNRRELGTAAAALLACDAVAVSAARALHTLPGQHSVWSSVAKKVHTELSEEVFARCADVLGTRSLLPHGRAGAFPVARADNAVVRHIDTGPVANLRLVGMQLGQLAATAPDRTQSPELTAAFTLDAPLPPLDLTALELSARGRDEVTQSLPAVRDASGVGLLDQLAAELADLRAQVQARPDPVALLDLAERFCYLHAAASCAHLWWANRHLPLHGRPPGDTGWLVAALTLLLDRAAGRVTPLPAEVAEPAFALVDRLHRAGRLFSAVPLRLAEATGKSTVDCNGDEDDEQTDDTEWPWPDGGSAA